MRICFLAFVLALLLSGCGAVRIGMVAVGTDENGLPVADIVVCEKRIDALLVRGQDDHEVGRFETAKPITTSAQIPLPAPGRDWTVIRPLVPLTEAVKYTLAGYNTQDSNVYGGEVVFTAADLALLGPDQVLWQDYREDEDGLVVPFNVVQSSAEFREHACDNR